MLSSVPVLETRIGESTPVGTQESARNPFPDTVPQRGPSGKGMGGSEENVQSASLQLPPKPHRRFASGVDASPISEGDGVHCARVTVEESAGMTHTIGAATRYVERMLGRLQVTTPEIPNSRRSLPLPLGPRLSQLGDFSRQLGDASGSRREDWP